MLTYHLYNRDTARVLPEIIMRLQERGATLGSVSDLPSPPPERTPLHQDFADLEVDPGYLRMHRQVAPPQMVNLLGLGADALASPNQPLPIGHADQGRLTLFVYDDREPLALPAATREKQIACLAGEAVLEVREIDETHVCTVYSRPGDMVGLRSGWKVKALPSPRGGRAILLLVE